MSHELAIVSGAGGSLGRAYLEAYRSAGRECAGVARSGGDVSVDLLNGAAAEQALRSLPLERYDHIVLVHAVGAFRFEEHGPAVDANHDGVDDDVYASNVITFESLLRPLCARAAGELVLCGFGSISEGYHVPWWASFSSAKEDLYARMRETVASGEGRIQGRYVRLGSMDTDHEQQLRPHADRRYWLQPREVVDATLPLLDSRIPWLEADLYKPFPGFDPGYYRNQAAVREKWRREMGLTSAGGTS